MQQPSNMVPVVSDAKEFVNHIGDPRRGPEVGTVSAGDGAAKKRFSESSFLGGRETGWSPGRGMDFIYPVALSDTLVAPAHDGTGGTTNFAGNGIEAQAIVQ